MAWSTGLHTCTSGFSAVEVGVQGMVTAGHCYATPPRTTYHGGLIFGTSERNSFVQASTADAMWVKRNALYPYSIDNVIYRQSSDKSYEINRLSPGRVGYVTCFSGLTTLDVQCDGRIITMNHAFYVSSGSNGQISGYLIDQAVSEGTCPVAGDSGGPVANNNAAQGIMVASFQPSDGSECPYWAYSPIDQVEEELDISIKIYD